MSRSELWQRRREMVVKSCDPPELRLSLGGEGTGGGHVCRSSAGSSRVEGCYLKTGQQQQQQEQKQQQQQLTIFYNGRICVCDVTEIQARAIISMAKQEMDNKMNEKQHRHHPYQQQQQQQQKQQYQNHHGEGPSPRPVTPASSPLPSPQLLNPGLSMKRSLQRFLQKRKMRMDAVSPYNHGQRSVFSSMA